MTTKLVLHRGGHNVERSSLANVECPAPTPTWYPIPHEDVADQVLKSVYGFGYEIKREQWALAGPGGEQMFGVLDTTCEIQGREIALAVGIRNSVDKSFAMGFCAGSRVFVCDNLAFGAELMVNRKHTKYGLESFTHAIHLAAKALSTFVDTERKRIERWQGQKITHSQRDQVILRSLDSAVYPKTMLADIFREQVSPTYAEFRDESAFGLFNNFTTVLRDRAFRKPNEHSRSTQKLTAIIDEVVFDLKPSQWTVGVIEEEAEVQA